METVLEYVIPGLMTLAVSGNVAGRLSRYLDRLGVDADDARAKVDYVFGDSDGFEGEERKLCLWKEAFRKPDGVAFTEMLSALPVFFETRYFFRADFSDSVKNVRVVHPMAAVTDCFNFSGKTLVGMLDFINAPGKFQLKLDVATSAGVRIVSIEFMVVSVKMDVVGDYGEILKKIECEQKNLVYAFLSKTLGGAGYELDRENSEDVVWYAILQKVFAFYRSACERVIHSPHLKYAAKIYPRRAEAVRKWSPQAVNRFCTLSEAQKMRTYFRTEQIEPEPDSIENRFVLFTLKELERKLEAFASRLKELNAVSSEYVKNLDEQRESLRKMVRAPFFRSVGRFSGFSQQSLVLQKRQGYAQIYEAWIRLKSALDPSGTEVDIGYRPISALYEFWCFLVMRDCLKEKYGPAREIAGNVSGLADLFEDEFDAVPASTLCKFDCVFTDKDNDREITLSYQKTYGTRAAENFAYLNAQRPDIVLSIRERGEDSPEKVFTYLFDAKYRIASMDEKDASPREAIDDMHRYRDAILYRSGLTLSREIVGAYVLFPGRPLPKSFDYEETMRNENIGAIPLLPSREGLTALENFMRRILDIRGASQHLEAVIPPRGASILVDSADAVRDVTVYGTSHGKEQIAWMRKRQIYNLPCDEAEKQGIRTEKDAKRKRWLLLAPPPLGKERNTRVFRILECAGIVDADALEQKFGYPRKPSQDRYWVWQIDTQEL